MTSGMTSAAGGGTGIHPGSLAPARLHPHQGQRLHAAGEGWAPAGSPTSHSKTRFSSSGWVGIRCAWEIFHHEPALSPLGLVSEEAGVRGTAHNWRSSPKILLLPPLAPCPGRPETCAHQAPGEAASAPFHVQRSPKAAAGFLSWPLGSEGLPMSEPRGRMRV